MRDLVTCPAVNAIGQVPDLSNVPVKDTPDAAKTCTGWNGHAYQLVFSEFNTEGRSFYPGDDPF